MEDSVSFKVASAVANLIKQVVFNGEFEVKSPPVQKVDRVLFGQKIANIVVAGAELRLILKVHYTDSLGEHFLRKYLNAKEFPCNKIDDFFLETCNLAAGRMKHGLVSEESSLGISIPIKTKGFDDLFFTLSTDGEFCSEWHWDFVSKDDIVVHSSLFIEILNNNLTLNLQDQDANKVDELEFF
jgi:hypothetical protein